jgi:hypothetical protein
MKLIFTLLIGLVSIGAVAQASQAKSPASSGDCFRDWYTLFKERGALPVADGTHDVIITVRNGNFSDCYMGRITVTGNKLSSKLLVQKVDGTYEEYGKSVSKSFQNTEGTLREDLREVNNGMSESITLNDGEVIRLFFFRSIAEKPKSNKKAPAPSALIKN